MTYTIYRIDCFPFLPYYGSTKQKLSKRLRQHHNNKKKDCRCSFFFKSGRPVTITAIETGIPTKNIALWRERYYIDNFCCANNDRPIISEDEAKTNKIRLNRLWGKRKVSCPCGGRYTLTHKARHFKSKKHQRFLNR